MITTVFMIYGEHNIQNINNALDKIRAVMQENKLVHSGVVSIVENSIEYSGFPDEIQLQDVKEIIKLKTAVEYDFLDTLKNKNETNPNTLSKPFPQALMEFLYSQNIYFEMERNDAEVHLKFIQVNNAYEKELERRHLEYIKTGYKYLDLLKLPKHEFFIEAQDLRDKKLIKQINDLSESPGKRYFIIVRGFLHQNLSKLLRNERYTVMDYFY